MRFSSTSVISWNTLWKPNTHRRWECVARKRSTNLGRDKAVGTRREGTGWPKTSLHPLCQFFKAHLDSERSVVPIPSKVDHLDHYCRQLRRVGYQCEKTPDDSCASHFVHGTELLVAQAMALHLSNQDQRLQVRPGHPSRLGEEFRQVLDLLEVEPHQSIVPGMWECCETICARRP